MSLSAPTSADALNAVVTQVVDELQRAARHDGVRFTREQRELVQQAVLDAAVEGTRLVFPEICLCAALRLDDGRVIRGHRHNDCLQTALKWRAAGQDIGQPRQEGQGFLTSRGRFVDRAEAMTIQQSAGARRPDGSALRGEELLSEDLY